MLTFLLKVEGQPDRKVEIDETPAVVGTAPDLAITISDPAADARHAEIDVRDVGVVLRDLSTAHGTRVNGDLVSQVRLSVGDVIEIGATKLVLTLVGAEAAPAPAARADRAKKRTAPTTAAPSRAEMARQQRKSRAVPILILLLLLAGGAAAVFILTQKGPERPDADDLDLAAAPTTGTAGGEGVPEREAPEAFAPDRAASGVEDSTEPPPEEAPAAVERPDAEAADPAAAAAAAARERDLRAERERRKREHERIRAAEDRYSRFLETLPERLERYAFDGPIADIVDLVEPLPTGAARGEALALQADLMRGKAVFVRAKEILAGANGRKVTLASGLTLTVVDADEEGFTAKIGPAETKKKWTELSPATIHDLVAKESERGEQWMDLSAFAALFSLSDVEPDLARAFEADAALKEEIDGVLARRRGTEVPDGGYFLHEGEWLTPEDKYYLDRGFVRHEGKWLTPDQLMEARGYVRHEDKWITKERYERILEGEREAEALAKKYLPKGLIDKPGNGEGAPWARASEKAPIERKTTHYKIKTNLGRDVANDLAYTMEILNANLKAQFGIRGKGARFGIYLVSDRAKYMEFWPRVAGASRGFCTQGEICTYYQPPMTTAVLMHEGTHQILRKFAPTAPRWLHEGVACYFECSQFVFNEKRRRVELEVGLLNAIRCQGCQAQIRSGRAVSIEKFIRGEGGDPYQQGWAFIYYLAKGKDGEYAPRLHAFIEEAHKKDVVERFQKIFRVKDMEEFDREWREWVLALDPAKGVRMDSDHR